MQHLVGNVAELVCDAPARVEEVFKSPSDLTAARLSDFVAQSAKEFRVVGGSALSPPEYWDGQARPFSRPLALDLAQAHGGYSDVGLRLAFTAPRDAPAARVAAVLKKHGYLPQLD